MTPELRNACAASAHVITTDGEILNGGRAALFILQMLGWRWTRIFSVPPLIWPVEVGYRLFVRNRSVLFPILARFVPRRSDPS